MAKVARDQRSIFQFIKTNKGDGRTYSQTNEELMIPRAHHYSVDMDCSQMSEVNCNAKIRPTNTNLLVSRVSQLARNENSKGLK